MREPTTISKRYIVENKIMEKFIQRVRGADTPHSRNSRHTLSENL